MHNIWAETAELNRSADDQENFVITEECRMVQSALGNLLCIRGIGTLARDAPFVKGQMSRQERLQRGWWR